MMNNETKIDDCEVFGETVDEFDDDGSYTAGTIDLDNFFENDGDIATGVYVTDVFNREDELGSPDIKSISRPVKVGELREQFSKSETTGTFIKVDIQVCMLQFRFLSS